MNFETFNFHPSVAAGVAAGEVILAVAVALLLAAGAVAVLLLVSALFVFTHDMLMKANAFPVQQIGVTGSGRLSKAAVVRRAGVERGDNILSVNLSKIKKRVVIFLQKLPIFC